MSELIIIDGDALTFEPLFGERTVTVTGVAIIAGSGMADIEHKAICIVGDEKGVTVNATYTAGPYQVPGQGIITIAQLAADQQALFCTAATPVIVKGTQFIASFRPVSQASSPNGPDSNLAPTPGKGQFIPQQNFVKAIS
ncbi:hypothetical protein [Erwinia oleae]|uniref:hypothetical protein n=1 Tax=Erwinia oleae TaxID=796334 RepID=UPI0005521592|nr:hypothetical protein [Erwinia oleae]